MTTYGGAARSFAK